jgi:hypothetical protein
MRVHRSRLVERFDFESTDASGQKIGQGHQLPPHWYIIGRAAGTSSPTFRRQPLHQRLIEAPGYPRFTEVGYDTRHTTSGNFSFHLGLNSGNAGAFLEVGAIAAVPRSDYLVTARVRTAKLKRAKGRLIAYFVDDAGRRVEASVQRSEPLVSDQQWTTVSLRLPGRFKSAAWIGLEVRLTQPTKTPRHPLDEQEVVLKDVRGHIWFDDISIWQLPHIQIRTQSPVNIVQHDQKPRVTAQVRDMTGQKLRGTIRVLNHRLKEVARTERPVGAGAANKWQWTPELPGFGWYLTELTMRGAEGATKGQAIARTLGAFLWLPKAGSLPAGEAERFGLIAEGMPKRRHALLPALLDKTGVGRVVLSAWREDDQAGTLPSRQQQLSEALEPLVLGEQRIGMALTPVPEALATAVGDETNYTLRALSHSPAQWLPFVRPPLHWHGQYVKRWQIGRIGADRLFFFPELEATVEQLDKRLRSLVPGPRIVLPWTVHQPPNDNLPDSVTYALDVPPAVGARHLKEYLEPWQADGAAYRLNLRQASAEALSHEGRVRQLVLRMLHAWAVDEPTMTLDKPWTDTFERRPSILPDPMLGAFATTARRLAGREVVGRLPLRDGLEAMILDGARGGMLAVWNRSAPAKDAQVAMYLGENPVAIDVWGNRRKLPQNDGKHQFTATRTPKFILGIDAKLALFRAGFKLKTSFIKSLQRPHERKLKLTNPWDHQITGDLLITSPEDWTIQPKKHAFSVPAGATREVPLTLSFPIAEVAGRKELTANVNITADRQYGVTTSAPMRLGLKNVKFDATLALEDQSDGTRDAIVNCVITNRGDEPLALYVFANLPGFPRKERLVAQLQAGQSVVRRFQFEEAGEAVQDRPVRAGLRETNGPAILNKLLHLNQRTQR